MDHPFSILKYHKENSEIVRGIQWKIQLKESGERQQKSQHAPILMPSVEVTVHILTGMYLHSHKTPQKDVIT